MAQQSSIQVWKPFEMVVDTTIAGTSGVGNFQIRRASATYRYKVEWGDGSVSAVTSNSDITHTYTSGGTYTIKIRGRFDGYYNNNNSEGDKIISINSWGNIAWKSLNQSFMGCANLSGITSTPPILEKIKGDVFGFAQLFRFDTILDLDMGMWDMNGITNFSLMFSDAASFNNSGSPSISGWTTSDVGSFSSMFLGASSFNQPIGSWDVSNVSFCNFMFYNATSFNQDIGGWDVSKVTNMDNMFRGSGFNNSGSTSISGWTTSACTNMSEMFNVTPFNQPIGSWDVSNVITLENTFNNSSFNQPLDNWVTSGVTNMSSTFENCPFDQDIGSWDVSNVDGTTFNNGFQGMFANNSSFNNGGSPSISGWTIGSSPVGMRDMFRQADAFNQPIGSWDVSNVTDMSSMFIGTDLFNQNLSNWDVGNVTTFFSTFNTTPFNNGGSPDISGWTLSNVTTTQSMFSSSEFNQPIGSWDTSNILNISFMFNGATLFNQPLDSWDVSNVTSTTAMFQNAGAFNQPLDSWDVGNVISMNGMFNSNTVGSFNQDISMWNVSNVTNMSGMFRSSPFNQDLSSWNVSGVTNMTDMLDNSDISLDNYNSILTGWTGWDGTGATKTLQSNVTFGVDGLTYSTGTTADDARNYLLTGLSWTINGDIGV